MTRTPKICARCENVHAVRFYVLYGKSTSSTGFLSTSGMTVTTANGSKAITPSSYTGLMVGETLTASGIPTNTTIASCNAGPVTTLGTPCTSNITLSANATGTSTALTVASAPLVTGTGTFIDGTQGVRFDGQVANDNSGISVAAGDINGDGIPDLFIGADGAKFTYTYTYTGGSVYVIYGKTVGSGSFLPGTTVSSSSGTSLTPASYTDLMVGDTLTASGIPAGTTIASCNSGSTVGTPCTSGALTLSASTTASGALTIATIPLYAGYGTLIDGIQGIRLDGTSNNLGYALATGDVNGDGITDLIVSDYIGNFVDVIFGQNVGSGTFLPNMTISTSIGSPTATVSPSYTGLMTGYTLASANISPGTTISACNAPHGGYNQRASTTITLSNNATANGSAAVTVAAAPLFGVYNSGDPYPIINGTTGVQFACQTGINGYCGWHLAAGDVNGDGYTDVIMSAIVTTQGDHTYVIFGKSGKLGILQLHTQYGRCRQSYRRHPRLPPR